MDSLVSTDWLAEHLADDGLVVLDASKHLPDAERDPRSEFLAAHIPGAGFLDLASLIDAASPVPNTVPTRTGFEARMGALGIAPGDRVVLYDDSRLASAARAWFVMRLFGHERVAILDGGLAKWRAEGRPLVAGPSEREGGGSYAAPAARRSGALRDKQAMLANIDSRAEQVVDARDADRFSGASTDTVHDLPGGHIPGARNLFFRDLFAEDGTYRSPEELRARFAEAGLDIERPTVASCGSGMTASVLLFALHLAGAEKTALYDGSWSEWGADPATPKQTGPAEPVGAA